MNRADLRAALSHPNVAAFLRVIREGESRQDDSAYRLENDGTPRGRVLPDYVVEHPSKGLRSPPGRAFGAYQFLASTWAGLVKKHGFENMGPACQDEAAVALILGRGALDEVLAGDLDGAFYLLHPEWTSLPGGSEENAATKRLRRVFVEWGGQIKAAPEAAPGFDPDSLAGEHYGEAVTESTINPVPSADEQEARMSPFILPALELAAKYLPALAEHFSSGSKSAVRNIAAGKVIADAITEATGSPNIQAAVEKLESRDPQATAAAKSAVADVLPMLVEAGGGGIKGARDAAEAQSGDWRKLIFSLPFVGLVVFTPAIWAVVAAAVFKAPWLLELDAQLRGTVIGFVLGTIAASIVGYIYGASMTKAPVQSLSRG